MNFVYGKIISNCEIGFTPSFRIELISWQMQGGRLDKKGEYSYLKRFLISKLNKDE